HRPRRLRLGGRVPVSSAPPVASSPPTAHHAVRPRRRAGRRALLSPAARRRQGDVRALSLVGPTAGAKTYGASTPPEGEHRDPPEPRAHAHAHRGPARRGRVPPPAPRARGPDRARRPPPAWAARRGGALGPGASDRARPTRTPLPVPRVGRGAAGGRGPEGGH